MPESQSSVVEQVQQAVVRLLATHSAGHRLYLIGGFRYRFLDQSARLSRDIDYHWDGDLAAKQAELVSLFVRRLLPEVRRRLGHEGDVRPAAGPGADSPVVRTIELAFWRPGVAHSRIELPVEITRIICLDPPAVRSASGVVYPTASDADLIESKVIALLNRPVIEHRDFCDLFLFASHLAADAARRLKTKLAMLSIDPEVVARRLREIHERSEYHIRMIAEVIRQQLDPPAAANIEAAGGARMVFDAVQATLDRLHLDQREAADEGA